MRMARSEEFDDDDKVSGVIKRVTLKNFMCHANFQVELGPRLNFIIGHNGSGKSSILTAISVCLGAKATETNRGSSLGDLIKEGTTVSEITVVLSNEGAEAYEPGTYGNEIIIQRVLRKGTKQFPYSLKSENGRKISSKKTDLDAILDYFGIAVSNPMSFLSQDMARSFLTASSDEQKYKFFMKGTLMSEMIDNFKMTADKISAIQARLIKMKQDVIELKEEASEAKAMHQRLKDSDNLRNRQLILHGKYFWLKKDEAVKVIQDIQQTLEEHSAIIDEIDRNIADENLKLEAAKKNHEHAEQKYDNLVEEANALKQEFTEKKTATKRKTIEAEKLKTKYTDTEKEVQRYEKMLADLDKQIRQEEEEIRRNSGGSKDVLEQQVSTKKTEEESLNSQIQELKAQLDQIDDRNKGEYQRLSSIADDKRESIRQIQAQISQAQSQRAPDPMSAYPEEVRRVVSEIQKTRFRGRVIGPLGRHAFLRPGFEDFSGIIESQLSAHVNSFVVENHADWSQLQSIMRRNRFNGRIITRRPERFNFSHGIPKINHPTILDALEFDDEDAKYTFIDQAKIEKMVLVKDRKVGQELLESGISNLRCVLALQNGDSGFELRTSNGAFLSNPIRYQYGGRPKIGPKTGVLDVNPLRQRLSAFNKEKDDIELQKQQWQQRVQQEKRQCQDQIKSLGASVRRLKTEIHNLEKKLEEDGDTGKLEALRDERDGTERQKFLYEQSLPDLETQIADTFERLQEMDKELNKVRAVAKGHGELVEQVRTNLLELESAIQLGNTKKAYHETKKNQRLEQANTYQEGLPAWEKKATDMETEATKFCSREEAESIKIKDENDLKRMIEQITKKVDAANELLGMSPEQIILNDEKANQKYQYAFGQFNQARKTRDLLNVSLDNRLKAFKTSRGSTLVQADMDFKSSLEFRNFSGQLDFDLKRNKLTMLVSTKNDKKPRHVDSLSGGEKSFSQIALLLATWKPMKSRIKGLDEFDVFMDQVNRKIGMKLMLNKLSNEVKAQTIFITPQDIGQIAELDPKFVRIHRVQDPRAHQ